MTLTTLGAIHLAAALTAFVLGGAVLVARKGTALHRTLGGGYVVALVMVNVTALGIYRLTGQFGPFHALALLSLAVLFWGVLAAVRRRPGWLIAHYHGMAWSYIGLLAATCAEVMIRLAPRGTFFSPSRAITIGVSMAILFTIVGLFILPRLQRTAMAQMGGD
jgi:uncharacterized membrane protein